MSAIDVALLMLALALALALVRVIRGPTVADRAVAADVCLYTVVAALSLLSIRLMAASLLDAVLIATMLGFVATLSLAILLRRKR
jgi:multicomponent Na+:H+ antiporter subunit F